MLCVERCLAALPMAGSGSCPAFSAATTLRWPGMMFMATFAVMIVAITAPVCSIAPRPEKTCWKTKATATTKTNSTAPSRKSLSPSRDLQSWS